MSNRGDADIPWLLSIARAVMFQSRCIILSRGFEPFGSFNLAGVGSFQPGNRRNRSSRPGTAGKSGRRE